MEHPQVLHSVGNKTKVLLHDENDETPRKNDLSALILCNPPALESYPKVVARHWKQKQISVSL